MPCSKKAIKSEQHAEKLLNGALRNRGGARGGEHRAEAEVQLGGTTCLTLPV